jgi:hypothetical protein
MLWLSLQGWENSMAGLAIIAGLSTVLAGVATWMVVILQRTEIAESKKEFDNYKLTVESKVADAKKEALRLEKPQETRWCVPLNYKRKPIPLELKRSA